MQQTGGFICARPLVYQFGSSSEGFGLGGGRVGGEQERMLREQGV